MTTHDTPSQAHPHEHPPDGDLRVVVWDLYCPRCLQPSSGFQHVGTEQMTRRVSCGGCGKHYSVTTRIDGQGLPRCTATPVFIRSPEIVSDSAPLDVYR